MTDPKAAALIEPSNAEQADWLDATFAYVHGMQDALRDLTAENERLTALHGEQFAPLTNAALRAELARFKALGDGLARYAEHDIVCDFWSGEECNCGMSAALAAWEGR